MPLSLLLRCADLRATRDFYTALPGFEVRESAEGTLTVSGFGGRIVFTPQDLWGQAPGMPGTLYFDVPDVDALHRRFTTPAALAPIAWPPQDMPYGSREFAIRDRDGYLLAFQQARAGA